MVTGGDVRAAEGGWGGEKGGEMTVDRPGQHVLQRSSVLLQPDGALEVALRRDEQLRVFGRLVSVYAGEAAYGTLSFSDAAMHA